jgi:hypothetical protein
MITYVDTSTLLKVVIEEEGSESGAPATTGARPRVVALRSVYWDV